MKVKTINPGIRFLILIVIILSFVFLGKLFNIDAGSIQKFFNRIPIIYSSLAFIVFYVLGTFVFWHLKDPLKIVAAIIFGAILSTFLIYLAEIINAYIFFNISSILGKDFVEKNLKGRFKRFYEKLENINFGWLFLLRLTPLIPYRILDMCFGLSKISFRKYLWIVLLASPLRIFWIQFILAAVKGLSPEKITLYYMENKVAFLWSLLYLVFTCIIAFKMKRKFK